MPNHHDTHAPAGDQHDPWQVVAKRITYANPWISVTHHDVIDPGGRPGVYGVVSFKNRAVGVLPLDADDHTWLVGQWRFPLGAYSWEIPEGGAPGGEDPLAAAQRELKEETGMLAAKWQPVLEMHLSNSVTDESSVSYLATELTHGTAEPESTEKLAVKRVPFAEVVRMVERGEITDALSVATILRVQLMRLSQPL